MHDAIVFALLTGASDSPRPWSRESRVAFLCPVPGYDRHFAICEQFGIEMIAGAAERRRTRHGGGRAPGRRGRRHQGRCGACRSTATRAAPSTRTRRSSGSPAMKTAAPDFRLFWDNAYAVHHLTAERIEIASIIDACARPRLPESAAGLRLDVEDHPGRRRRVAVRRVGGQRRVVPQADGQAHHRRRQDQSAPSRALPAGHGGSAGADGSTPRDHRRRSSNG